MKATPEEYDFHQRLLARDPTAFAEMAERFYAELVRRVGARAGRGDPALVEEAVGQALLDYNDHPERYDPERASLIAYLVMAGYRDFQNARAAESRKTGRDVSLSVDDSMADQITDTGQERDLERLFARLQAGEVWRNVEVAFPDPIERRIIMLLANGVRSTDPYADVLGLQDLAADERVMEVKRVKDRITKRLRRLGDNLDA